MNIRDYLNKDAKKEKGVSIEEGSDEEESSETPSEESDEGGAIAEEFGVSPECMARLVKYIASKIGE